MVEFVNYGRVREFFGDLLKNLLRFIKILVIYYVVLYSEILCKKIKLNK